MRRGSFQEGEKVQFTDRKGKRITVQLVGGQVTQTDHGLLRHDDVIGAQPGSVIVTVSALGPAKAEAKTIKNSRRLGGWEYTVMRPRMIDYSLSMPRGPQVMYPKDVAQVISLGDIRRGARVLESGGGSGAMSLALIDAVGPDGQVLTIERRADFAQICAANVELYFGQSPAWWEIRVDGFDEGAGKLAANSFDCLVLDMLDPWNRLEQAERVLVGGGLLVAYVTTTTQMSRLCEGLRSSGRWTSPEAVELLERSWKAEGLAVRPDHQMIGHTGFLVVSRVMSAGVRALEKRRRATKDTYTDIDALPEAVDESAADRTASQVEGAEAGSGPLDGPIEDLPDASDLELRDISDRKVRKVLRDLGQQLTVARQSRPREERALT